VLLTASGLATCSLARFQPMEPRFWRSYSSLRAPMMTLAAVGRCRSQLSEILQSGLARFFRDFFDGVYDLLGCLLEKRTKWTQSVLISPVVRVPHGPMKLRLRQRYAVTGFVGADGYCACEHTLFPSELICR
jgi:hypothetical protein